MKIKTIAHIHFQKYSWEEKGEYRVASFKLDDNENRTYVGEQEIEIEVPDNYDPRAQQIAALEALKQKVMADYHKSVMEINERIGKLLALEAA
jgi:N-acetyl-anhydromuramyl-L-alanine amidase AmpD